MGIIKKGLYLKELMKKSKYKLANYWDKKILKIIPPYARFDKVESEIREHFSFLLFTLGRMVLPLVILYLVIGLVMGERIWGPLLISLAVFLYSNFVPDIDFLIGKADKKHDPSLWYEKYFVLLFAPIFFYYVLIGKANPIRSESPRCFHNVKSLIIYTLFLFIIAQVFWEETVKITTLPLFGFLGYSFHLIVDGVLSFKKVMEKK